jgi:uncharacterized protein YjiS (DUF1127 family)
MSTTLTSKCTLAGAVRAPGPRRAASWPIATRLAESLFVWLDRSRGRHHLHTLDDRMLQDIGLTRADVDFEVHKHFWTR